MILKPLLVSDIAPTLSHTFHEQILLVPVSPTLNSAQYYFAVAKVLSRLLLLVFFLCQWSPVSLLLEQIELAEFLEKGCILVTIRPIRISGKGTSKEFIDWIPPQS